MARLAVHNIRREYPNAPGHLLTSAADLHPPSTLHPAFYGSYDWHSSVHQHWLLVRLLRLKATDAPEADAARTALRRTLTAANLAVEAAYLRDRPTFERTYGWAWLLALAAELGAWSDDDAAAWLAALQPAVEAVRENWLGFLQRTTYPIRAGVHANSAFGLTLAIDYARSARDEALRGALVAQARSWFADDRAYPAHLEPGGDDFLSGSLIEAALMARLLDRDFDPWLAGYLPRLAEREPSTLFTPAVVADRSDAKTVHLDGLNLSRAWCWRLVAAATRDESVAAAAVESAERHLDAALPHLFSGEYVGDHWTSTFALLALTADA